MPNSPRNWTLARPVASQTPARPSRSRGRRPLAAGLLTLTVTAGLLVVTPPAQAFTAEGPNGIDTVTGGDWSFTYDLADAGTVRAYNYGTFGYVLPDAPGSAEYEVGGHLTTNASLDETGGPAFGDDGYAGEQATYSVHGPSVPENRSVLLPDGTQRRQAACFGGTVGVSLPLAAGDYRIAVYAVDYDRAGRIETQLTASDNDVATQTVSNFSNGIYALYEVHSDGIAPVELTTVAAAGPNAVISGVFVDSLATPVTGVAAAGFDTTTQGNWIGQYGTQGYLLCGANVPGVNYATSWSPAMDLSSGLGAYTVSGNVWSWTSTFPSGPIAQPAYAWAWSGFEPQIGGSPASATFWKYNSVIGGPSVPGLRRATAWDSGDDMWGNTPRTMSVDLHVPANSVSSYDGFQVAFYFQDVDANRTQDFTLTDVTRGIALDTQTVTNFHGGAYYRYLVPAGTDLRLDVTRVAGVNAVLSGIFLDELNAEVNGGGSGTGSEGITDAPRTPGFWANWENKYSEEQFDSFLDTARDAGAMFEGITVAQATDLLASDAKVMANQLRRFALTVLINQGAGLLRSDAVIDLSLLSDASTVLGAPTVTVSALVAKVEAAYTGLDSDGNPTFSGWTKKEQEIVKNVAEAVCHFAHHDAKDIGILVG